MQGMRRVPVTFESALKKDRRRWYERLAAWRILDIDLGLVVESMASDRADEVGRKVG